MRNVTAVTIHASETKRQISHLDAVDNVECRLEEDT